MIEKDFSRAQLQLEEVLGGKEFIDALHSTTPSTSTNTNSDPDENNDEDSPLTIPSTATATTTGTSLAHRKLQLQKELMALKEKLEKNQQKVAAASSNNNNDQNNSNNNQQQQIQVPIQIPIILTKEELERRKIEAKNDMDISYWKHFVSKQEHILQNVTKQVIDNEASLEQCLKERHSTNIQLNSIQNNINTYGAKQDVIEDGIIKTTMSLLNVRQQLYDATTTTTTRTSKTLTHVASTTNATKKDNDKKR
jgi:hypothetical protein